MEEGVILDVLRQSLWTAFTMSLPILSVSLLVGLIIGLIQALTSVQEMTLTFVPKLAAMLAVFWISMGTMGQVVIAFFSDYVLPLVENV